VARRRLPIGARRDGPVTAGGEHRPMREPLAPRVAPHVVHEALSRPGRALEPPDLAGWGARFGHDFSAVRVHDDADAHRSARAVGAHAYTVGCDIVFGAGRHAPSTAAGRRLLAHELTHVIQQSGAAATTGPIPLGHPADPAEDRAYRQADTPGSAAPVGRSPLMLQGDFGAPRPHPGGLQGKDAVIPVARFIADVEEVERANAGDTPRDVLSRIRVQYYGADSLRSMAAFGQLIPDSAAFDLVRTPLPMGGMDTTVVPRSLGPVSPDTRSRLLAHADENRAGGNPSPYLLLPDGQLVDVGHVLLSMDALLHPLTASPYTDYSVPNIDAAGWVADVGIASVWLTRAEEGDPHPEAPSNAPPPSVDAYFRLSAPDEDLLGDVDAFRLKQNFSAQPSTLSAALRTFYLGGGTDGTPGTETRYQTFCAGVGLTYRRSGSSIVWDSAWHNPMIHRIDRFNDLYDGGPFAATRAMVTGGTKHRFWPRTLIMFNRFLAWLKPRLEAELAGPAPRRP
jgi:hypothetical protein